MLDTALEARRGRPSCHPVPMKYFESEEIVAAMQEVAETQGLSVSAVQRIVNRAGLQALGLRSE